MFSDGMQVRVSLVLQITPSYLTAGGVAVRLRDDQTLIA